MNLMALRGERAAFLTQKAAADEIAASTRLVVRPKRKQN